MICVMARFLGMYKDTQQVDYWEAIQDLGLMEVLEGVEGTMRGDGDVPIQGMDVDKKKKKQTKCKKSTL